MKQTLYCPPANLTSRKLLCQWANRFFGYHVFLFWLLSLFYLFVIFPLPPYALSTANKVAVGLFIASSFIGHFALLAFLPSVIVIPFVYLFPQRQLIFFITIASTTLASTLLLGDTICYSHFHFHLNGVLFSLITSGQAKQIFVLSWFEWLIASGFVCSLLLLEFYLAQKAWRQLLSNRGWRFGGPFFGITLSCLLLSYNMLAWGAEHQYQAVTQTSLAIPFYNNFLTALMPTEQGLQKIETVNYYKFTQTNQPNRPLHYPLQPLLYQPSAKPLNIVLIVIDTWRFDMLNSRVTPTLAKFAQNSWQFTQHFSGGNCTQPGIFSLFYGLPNSYWTAMTKQQKSPVLMDAMRKQHYHLGIFASATLTAPAFDENVFLGVPNLAPTPGTTPYQRDQAITHNFAQFITQNVHTPQPFFSFLFYDAAHSYCAAGNPIQLFQPAITTCNRLALTNSSDPKPYLNRYQNALYSVDQLIAQDLAVLNQHHLLQNTVVIITGDHGNEFNDNKRGFWEHASNYSRYQVQTPLIIHWPHQTPAHYSQVTSHYDLAPTLLSQVLGCKNKPEDYSIGSSLFAHYQPPSYLVAGSYIDFGIIEKDRITEIFPMGNYAITDQNLKPLASAKLNAKVMGQVFTATQKFYRTTP